jgi:hypothetical protein
MPATLLGTTGTHGIASDESANGLIIESISETSKKQSNFIKDKSGQRVGRADYDESIEIVVKGELTSATPFAQKLSAQLVLANAISAAHLQAATAGKTYIDEVQRERGREDWAGITVNAELLPFFP